MIQQAEKASGAQGVEGKSFPPSEPCSAVKWVIECDTSSSEQGTCSSSLHFAEGKAGILVVSLPSSSASIARDRAAEAAEQAAHLPLSCCNSLPGSLTQIETNAV